MLKDIVEAGGSGLLIPAVLFALVLYAARGLFGLQGRKSQHRREFIEQWDLKRVDDDLWLEVTIRQLFGTYLPAHVIRLALAEPANSRSLIELSELWFFLHYEPGDRTVRWKRPRYSKSFALKFSRYWPTIRYLLFALTAAACGLIAYQSATALLQWVYSTLAVVFSICAFISLMYDDAVKIADEAGENWIARINSAVVSHTPADSAL